MEPSSERPGRTHQKRFTRCESTSSPTLQEAVVNTTLSGVTATPEASVRGQRGGCLHLGEPDSSRGRTAENEELLAVLGQQLCRCPSLATADEL